jgi:hypothetical protein
MVLKSLVHLASKSPSLARILTRSAAWRAARILRSVALEEF